MKTSVKILCIKHHDEHTVVKPENILRCEASNSYVTLYFFDLTKPKLLCISLNNLEMQLKPHGCFVRIHESHLVNLDYMLSFRMSRSTGCVKLCDNSMVPVSCRMKKKFMNHIRLLHNTKRKKRNG